MGSGKDVWNEFERLTNQQEVAATASLFGDDAVYIEPGRRHEGQAAIAAYLSESAPGFSDNRMETILLVEDGDTFVAEWHYRGTIVGGGTFQGEAETSIGRTLDFSGVSVGTVKDGKFATLRDYYDAMQVMQQLGLMPDT